MKARTTYAVVAAFLAAVLIAPVGLALTVEKASLDKLTTDSHLIVRGRVISQTPFWDGQNINTRISLSIDELYKGEKHTSKLNFINLGGRLGDKGEEVIGAPEFSTGEEVVLFLVSWKGEYWIHSIVLGKFSVITNNGVRYVVNDLNNVGLIDPITKQEIIDPTAKVNTVAMEPFVAEVRRLASQK